MKSNWIAGIVASVGLGLAASSASAITSGFQGEYAPANWSVVAEGDSSVDTTDAPNSIMLIGSDEGSGDPRRTNFTIQVLGDGFIEFDWQYLTLDEDGPNFDPALFILNNDADPKTFSLSSPSGADAQSGSESIFVFAGQVIGFGINSTDDDLGRAFLTISNFSGPSRGDVVDNSAVPEPVTAGLSLLGLAAAGMAASRRR